MNSVSDVSDRYLNVAEAAALLKLSAPTVRDLVYKRRLPYRKHGRRVVFSLFDLIAWSDARKVDSQQ